MDICFVFFISKFLRSFYFLICVIYFNEVAASHFYLNLSTFSTPVFSIFLRSFYFLCMIHLYEVAASRFYLNLHQPAAFSAFSVAFQQLSPAATKTAKELTKPKAIQPTKLPSKPTDKPNNQATGFSASILHLTSTVDCKFREKKASSKQRNILFVRVLHLR